MGGTERLQDNRQPSPAVQGLDLSLFTELSVQMLKLGGHLEVGGWLPVSLTEFGHGHGFNTVSYTHLTLPTTSRV